ncbi:hypothetical protein ACPCSC_33190 [Streptomyces lavendulocolor]|uniref:hypothetical protein n=1 Tax=Streptomyces lavendulocolor TaxID=67316 RepID=UPI003C2B8DE9
MPATHDYSIAVLSIEALAPQGIEGSVAKPGRSAYQGGDRIWQKVRHTEVVEVAVIGYTGASARPRNLAVRLPNGRTALSQRLGAVLANAAAPALSAAGLPLRPC